MESKGVRQTKLAFAATAMAEKSHDTTMTNGNEETAPTKKKLSFAAAIGTPH
jgi:hypothetical protein